MADRLELLGHVITNDGITVSPTKVQNITDWTVPTNRKELQQFLGTINYVS